MARRIMVLEDEEAISGMIAMNLRVAGMEPVVFSEGLKVRDSLPGDHAYDLALLDVMVPGLDGFGVFELLKPYKIPAIFLTARDDLDSKLHGLTGGAEDYIVKPFQVLELLVRMEKVLARTAPREILRVLDLEIDLGGHRVRKAGVEVALKPMEFDLLVALVRNKNIAISREDLIGLVWGSAYLGETRTVDVHIGQLRKKLGLQNAIKTVPKLGYRLEDGI
ncbi:response regulator transcription factor [Acutalibacter muris]|uniref:Stage 0 sporulation protein A homolog n=1 Tax=Acutalibacter muris TaxID=1796620 RepID=A0A1Z2XN50_9FIRM|nr:response regulator transcription factor [Acutalibacter muris]ANU53458.1 DNA-binding response regulator [Hungateiclostridiaceae bacterium KB18]ASB39866.1 DNA-binding response regulator [Acutalibacter muris]QQR29155.1 response regulator transcription factor [Acutalibacter muris]